MPDREPDRGQVRGVLDPAARVHARIAAGLGRLAGAGAGEEAPAPYLRRHLVAHADLGGVLDDATVPAVFLPWEASGEVRGRLGLPLPQDERRRQLAGWAVVEPRAADLDLSSRRVSLALHAAPPAGQGSLERGWQSWRIARNVLADTGTPVRALCPVTLPDGRPVVVSAGDDATVRVWDLATGALVGDPFTGHTSGVYAVAVTALDGRPVVVSAGHDRAVRVWDLATGAPVGDPFTGHTHPVSAVAVTTLDGRPVVVSAGHDRAVRVWDLATGAPVGDPFTGHTSWVDAVAVTALDGRPVVVSASWDGTVRVWDLATGAPVGDPFTGHTREVDAVAVTALDGRPVVVSASDDATVRVWDLATGTPVGDPFTGHTRAVSAVAVTALDGRPVVVSASNDATVRVWDLRTRQRLASVAAGDAVGALAVPREHPATLVIGGGPGVAVFPLTR